MKFLKFPGVLVSSSYLLAVSIATKIPPAVPRHEILPRNSFQGHYTCKGSNDYDELTPGGLNGTNCVCGDVSIIQPPTKHLTNLTDFSDPGQCTDYVLMSARGTLESPGVSLGSFGMVFGTLALVPNGAFYAVRYPAAVDQNTTLGVQDVIKSIHEGLNACPNRTYVLYGVSQGASLVLRALPEFTDEMFNSVKAVVLVASPFRSPGKRSNVDGLGRHTKKSDSAAGIYSSDSDAIQLSEKWDQSGKVIDICQDSDGVCNSKQACSGLTLGHLTYGLNQAVQALGIKHVVARLLNQA